MSHIVNWLSPKTLLARTLVILCMPLLLVHMVLGYMLLDKHTQSLLRQLSHTIAGEVAIMSFQLNQNMNHSVFISLIKNNLGITVKQKQNVKHSPQKSGYQAAWLHSHLDTALQEKLTQPYQLFIDMDSIYIYVQGETGWTLFQMARKKLLSRTTPMVLLWTILSSILFLLTASVFMRNQVRPIKRLAKAAERFGKGDVISDFKPEGALEVRLAGQSFVRMQERLQVLLTERTQMLAGVSHDLRTPLTRMRLQLSMMTDTIERSGLLEDVNQMQYMIEEFLNYARGAHPEKRQLCAFKELIHELIHEHQNDEFKISPHYHGVKRHNRLNVSIKKTLVKRLLTNLIVNSKVSGTLLKITVNAKERHLQVFVDDNGCGIPVHERENVFQPFYRLDSARQSEKGSVGLGLSIVRDAVRSHGGEVFLEDSPLGGVRVVLNLPT